MIKFAIIGFGHIGRRHAKHIMENPETKLVAVCDINEQVKSDLPASNISFFTHLNELLTHTEVDVVSICTPNYLHSAHTIEVLNSGKHAVVEKPMALSSQECEMMIECAQANNKIIFAVKQNRYNPPVQLVKEQLLSGRLGKVLMMQVNCFWNRSDAYYAQSAWRGSKKMDGGCLFTQFSHFVDILYYLNGPILSAKGAIYNFLHQHNTEFEDSGTFILKAANDALINFNFTTCSFEKNMEGSITIFAEKGTIKIGGQYLNTIEYQSVEGEDLPKINISSKENDYGLYKGSMSNHDKIIQNVVDVLEHEENVMTSGEEGKAVVEIIEMMYASVFSSEVLIKKDNKKQLL